MDSYERCYDREEDIDNVSFGSNGYQNLSSGLLLPEQREPWSEYAFQHFPNETLTTFQSDGTSQEIGYTAMRYLDEADSWKSLTKGAPRPPSVSSFSSSSTSSLKQSSPTQAFVACTGVLTAIFETSLMRKCAITFRYLDVKIKARMSRSRFHGWRMGVLFGVFSSLLILLFNIAVLVAVACKGNGFQDGFGQPFNYEPVILTRISVGIHVLINALSTLLLAASNYTMQVLSSPTREDLEKAHQSGNWYDIGVLSTRNLRLIPRRRLLLCVILGLSSAPLHLFYNSAAIYIASTIDHYNISLIDENSTQWQTLFSNDSYATLSHSKWAGVYDTAILHHGDLYFAVDGFTNSSSDNYTSLSMDTDWPKTISWMTEFDGTRDIVKAFSGINITEKPHDWLNLTSIYNGTMPAYAHITHVLERKAPGQDRIVFVLGFLIIVITCNVVKLVTMSYVLIKEKAEFNVTLGDTAASFLDNPDSTTEKMSAYPRQHVVADIRRRLANDPYEEDQVLDEESEKLTEDDPRVWRKYSHPYIPPVNKSRSLGSYFIIAVTCVSFPICTAASLNISRAWGTASDNILGRFNVDSTNTLLVAWLSNTPQLILSFCYLSINSACTSIAGAHEWNKLGTSRKGLRVTKPYKNQRSTYFLQLPYRWSLPLAAVSGGIHWLLSQSIFLVRIDYYNQKGDLLSDSRLGCGISCLSIVVLCVIFWVLVVAVALMGHKLLRVRIPFAASCSVVISAACHPPLDEVEPNLEKVQWGVVEERMFEGELHCSLSSRPVKKPKPGTKYL